MFPHRLALCAIALLGAGVCASATPAVAQAIPDQNVQSPIGKVTDAEGVVSIQHNTVVALQVSLGGSQTPKAGDAVYKGDVVQTGADGKINIVFSDGTAFNLLKNARIELNEFIYDPNSKSNAAKFSILKGTLTFVAGQAAKTGSMTVDTPVGTMGIRGTTPRVEILDDGSVRFSTLVEDNKSGAIVPSQPGRRAGPVQQRQTRSAAQMTPAQDAAYDRFINLRPKICNNC